MSVWTALTIKARLTIAFALVFLIQIATIVVVINRTKKYNATTVTCIGEVSDQNKAVIIQNDSLQTVIKDINNKYNEKNDKEVYYIITAVDSNQVSIRAELRDKISRGLP